MKSLKTHGALLAVAAILNLIGSPQICGQPEVTTSQIDSRNPLFSGVPPLVPRWAYEPWVWEDNGNTQQSTEKLVSDYKSHGIPTGVVIVDSPWSTAYSDFRWDEQRYPHPAAMIHNFHAEDVRVLLWMTGCLNAKSEDVPQPDSDYDLVKSLGFAVNDGLDYHWWKGRGRHLDFTNPAACAWWGRRMDRAAQFGVDGWKVDEGEAFLPDRIKTSIGTIARETFKPYYYGAIEDYAVSRKTDALIMARPFSHQDGWAAPVAKCAIGWSGDFSGDWLGLQLQLDNLYRSAAAGYGVLYVEIGGYYQKKPTKAELIRYTQFGALMPVMSNGGSNGGLAEHLPWFHDEETVQIYRYFATLHSELGDYLFSCGVDSHLHGGSVVRFPDIEQRQHLLGPNLFVAVIAEPGLTRRVRFPRDDRWIDWWEQRKVFAPGSDSLYASGLARCPLFVRAGAVLAMNVKSALTGNGDKESEGKRTLVVFPCGASHFDLHLPLGSGLAYDDVHGVVNEATGQVTVKTSSAQPWRIRIKSFGRPTSVQGADRWSYDAQSEWLTIDRTAQKVAIVVQGLKGYEWLQQNQR